MTLSAQQPGVYAVWCADNDTRYIGSAARKISNRWGEHRYALRNNKHRSGHMQNAWNKYGESSFHFIVLENTSPEGAIPAEERWCQHFKSLGARLFNKRPVSSSQLGTKKTPESIGRSAAKLRGVKHTAERIAAQKERMKGSNPEWMYAARIKDWPPLVSPTGEVHTIRNLNAFCDMNGLDVSTLRKVALGKMKHHRGWRLLPEGTEPTPYSGPLPRHNHTYHLTSPSGEKFTTNNLEAFARERGLNPTGLRAVIRGEYRHHHGWVCHRSY